MKLLIVGGVAGGASAATRARRLDETMEIIIFERTGYISYATCGLPYYIGGEIKAESSLSLNSPESFKNRFNIDVRTLSDVIAVNPDRKTITVKNLATNLEYEESYDKLVLSPGAKPIRPDLKGIHKQGIFALRTLTDSFEIKEFINETNPQTAVIVGGGFIGLEMAENLINLVL
ncbi:MAG: NAD(P)/FAD-dependent oxidoreductase, partial [Anaerotignaceae bacterium]